MEQNGTNVKNGTKLNIVDQVKQDGTNYDKIELD